MPGANSLKKAFSQALPTTGQYDVANLAFPVVES
jgi:hypothetical protein